MTYQAMLCSTCRRVTLASVKLLPMAVCERCGRSLAMASDTPFDAHERALFARLSDSVHQAQLTAHEARELSSEAERTVAGLGFQPATPATVLPLTEKVPGAEAALLELAHAAARQKRAFRMLITVLNALSVPVRAEPIPAFRRL